MTAKPVALEKARRAKQAALAKIEHLEMMNRSWQIMFGRLLERIGAKAVTYEVAELDAFDSGRVVIVDMSASHERVIVGLKDDGDQPLELTALRDRALADASEEPANDQG